MSAVQSSSIPARDLLAVPLSMLVPSARNVRRAKDFAVGELADSIARIGLLQNLTVTQASDGERYEVVAGRRRLEAMKLLVKRRQLPKDHEVTCLVVEADAGRAASLTENVLRQAMHPLDEYEAFAALAADGRSIEDIAADFGVTPLVVHRRLKLANLSPRLLADYRADEVRLDQLMALATTDDHARQERAFYEAASWARSPEQLRARVTDSEVDAETDPLARYVGVEAYHAAGGVSRGDLFSRDGNSVLLGDGALLERLALDKLAPEVERLKAESWQWVTPMPRATHHDLYAFHRLQGSRREPSARQAKRVKQLHDEQDAIAAQIDGDDDGVDREALEQRSDAIEEELESISLGLLHYREEDRARSGVVVTLGRRGEVLIHRGLSQDAPKKNRRAASAVEGEEQSLTPAPAVSEALARRLSAHRTAALQVEVARRPDVALAAVVHTLVMQLVRHDYWSGVVDIRPHAHDRLDSFAPGIGESAAAVELQKMVDALGSGLPEDADAVWTTLLARPEVELLAMLAVCVALTVNAVTPKADVQPASDLARAVGLDMTRWWSPTAASYFGSVPKARILAVVKAIAPGEVDRLSTLKKDAMAAEAERLASGTDWLPEMLRAPPAATAAD